MSNAFSPIRRLKSLANRFVRPFRQDPDAFLGCIKGVIHVGANLGQERDLYAARDLNVVWIEPIPAVFQKLQDSIGSYPKQRAFCQLITDVDDQHYSFNIGGHMGESSSILELAKHKLLWPEVTHTETINLRSLTLSSLMRKEELDPAHYDALVMDTQGAELLVLKGAADRLPCFKFIKSEVADFESYKGCCLLTEMDAFLQKFRFQRIATRSFASHAQAGSYYNVVYSRRT